ncbi:MAG: PDZ domain-containing protein [Dactylosporangium sp.]|nr:PDZ domain-containing protein [Dactylosporangium sp.]NNJ63092.1 PDZ domain-containing protein [Dactylosporangium sp.]
MKRRGVTVLVGSLLLTLLVWQIGWVRVSYVELGPGPTVNVLGTAEGNPVPGTAEDKPIIEVSGTETTTSAGQLLLVTVAVQPELTLLDALRGWWDGDTAVVPREMVYPPDKTEEEVDEENTKEFQDSQSSAETAALRALGYPVEVAVTQLSDGFPAASVLAVGDVITKVDGQDVTSVRSLVTLIRAKDAGAPHEVTYRRGAETRTASVGTKQGDDGTAKIGVGVEQRQPHPFTLNIELDEIGGPSAGMMFALGIIDMIKAEDLTGGMIIAGTGTIDDDGQVGPIGGIPQKLVAAKRDKAVAFMTPAANCAEALANAQPDLPLVRVDSLREALDALTMLRAHQTPPLCTR